MKWKYILDSGHKPIAVDDWVTWATWFEREDNVRVALTEVGPYRVSTVFLGIDHNYGDGPPILFETMTFRPGKGPKPNYKDLYCERYSTWDEAVIGHAKAVEIFTARTKRHKR